MYVREAHHARCSYQIRALPEQRDLIDYAASLLGKNRSDFMLEVVGEPCTGGGARSNMF
ncbi:type II toxin-antitoxin system TacA family antitoxin [Paraburkholderia bannensis]|uniref:type II toxin-antitoxin system TacA family antitoxin n=1 Tax=Paraburkholderia bannensis TaxID=765414 RepID=UPI0038CD57DD